MNNKFSISAIRREGCCIVWPKGYSLTLIAPVDTKHDTAVRVTGRKPDQMHASIPQILQIIQAEHDAATASARRAEGLLALAEIGRHHVSTRNVKFEIIDPKK